ncbi:MAG: site-specific integrase [Candidatus Thermoplasmatota archaeon]|nr:site-specific integrase [Candidatus Thermoplasmatota archaeon]
MISQELLDKFRDYLIAKDCSEGTIINYTIAVKQLIDFIQKEPQDITQADLDKFKVYMKNRYEQNTLIPKIHGINNFLKFIKKKCKLKAPNYLNKNKDCLTHNEIKQLFEVTKNNLRDNAIIKTLYYTGIRRSELNNLNIEDIDFDKQKIRINNGKGNTFDTINIHQVALDAIKKYIESHPQKNEKNLERPLFLNYKNQRIGYMSIENIVKEAAAKAEINKRIYPHLFRASLITHMDENGASMMDIKAQSRHKDIKTLEIYIRHSDKHLKNVYINTVPNLDEPRKTQIVPQIIEPITQPQIIPQTQQSREDKYIELLKEKLIDKEDFIRLMGLNHQHIDGYM